VKKPDLARWAPPGLNLKPEKQLFTVGILCAILNNARDREKDFLYCGFYLAVYDETGLLYYGEYMSSLDAGSQMYRRGNLCQRIQYSPLTASWMG